VEPAFFRRQLRNFIHEHKEKLVQVLCRLAPRVAVVQSAQALDGSHGCCSGRLLLEPIRPILFQGIMNAVSMMVVHVITDEPSKMLFVRIRHMNTSLTVN
jgi:hypothetical protein